MVTIPLGFLFRFSPDALLGVFGIEDPRVLHFGKELLAYLSVSTVFLIISLSYTGALQGGGEQRPSSDAHVGAGESAVVDVAAQLTQRSLGLALCAMKRATV